MLNELPPPETRAMLRRSCGLTQADAARAVDVTPACVGFWESGKSEPRGRNRRVYTQFLAELRARLVTSVAA